MLDKVSLVALYIFLTLFKGSLVYAAIQLPPPPTLASQPSPAPANNQSTTTPQESYNATQTLPQESNNQRKQNEVIYLSTASSQGVYYPVGSNICRLLNHNRNTIGLDCKALLSAGSVRNLELLTDSQTEFALVQADLAKAAFEGSGIFESQGPNDKLRFVLSLHDEPLTIIVKKDSGITDLEGIKGKTVNISENKSGVNRTLQTIFKAKGWDNTTFQGLTNLPLEKQPSALCNGQIDVMIALAGTPNKVVQRAAKLCEVSILEINDPVILSLAQTNPESILTKIPGGVYLGIPQDVQTIGVKSVLLSSTYVSEQVVYKATQAIFDNLPYLQKINKALSNVSAESMMSGDSVVPIHPGALKYFTEAKR